MADDLKDGHFRALKRLAVEVDRLTENIKVLDVVDGGLSSRITALEGETREIRRILVTVLTELRARGLEHLPEPEKARDIRLSKQALRERRRELAAMNRKHSKGRPRKKASG